MKILNLEWRNFMSYGNKWQKLEFNTIDSLNLLVGFSGNGKSSIRYVLEFVLYGKVTGRVLKDLPNRLNKNLEVKIILEASNHRITIHRGLEPSIFSVGVSDKPNFDKMGSKINVQDELEKLFGIPNHIFNNTMSLSINDFKSFIRMKAEDKRRIIDKVFGLAIINKMRETLKIELKEIKSKSNSLKIQINSLVDELNRITKKLEEVHIEIKENNQQRKDEIKVALEKFKKLYKKINIKESEILDMLQEHDTIIKDLDNRINKVNKVIYLYKEKMTLFDNDQCPTCGTDLNSNFFEGLKADYIQELKTNKEIVKTLQNERDTWFEEMRELKSTLDLIKEKKNKYNVEIRRLDDESDSLNEVVDVQMSSIEDLKFSSESKLKNTKLQEQEIGRELNFYELVDQMLSENGIKKLAMKTILPPINAQLKQLTKTLGIIYNVKFNDNFDSIITHNGEEISVVTLSTGETKKLDTAVLIAIIKLMKLRFSGLNLLFLDEVFSSLDSISIFAVVNILKILSEELKLHIFVVNHSQLDTNQFTNVYEAQKKNSFSDLLLQIKDERF